MSGLRRIMLSVAVFVVLTSVAYAAPGDLLGTVTLPGNGSCNVAGTFDCTYYMAIDSNSCFSSTIGIYLPPIDGNGAATRVSTKNIVDGGVNDVNISALAWDPSRGRVWGAYDANIYLIDVGDPTVDGNAVATWQFNTNVGGISLVDGLAYDPNDDTLYYSPDVDANVYHFTVGGTLSNTVTPKDSCGIPDGRVSGVAIGSGNTLYIARNGAAEIRLVDKTTGAFISQFATTSGRVEDLTCDPITYAPNEAILAKDAFSGLYEAFEVEPGTCPCIGPVPVDIDIKPQSCPNPLNVKSKGVLPVAILGSEDLDVMTIDLTSIRLEGVAPIRSSYEDVAAPVIDGQECECTTEGADGFTDLTLKFETEEIVSALGEVIDGEVLALTITGVLSDETPIEGTDCITIIKKGGGGGG
jgi:hypothetical protein